jgi:hypothetical protein
MDNVQKLSNYINISSSQTIRSYLLKDSLWPGSAGFLLGLLFDAEDRGYIFLRHMGLFADYTTLQLERP